MVILVFVHITPSIKHKRFGLSWMLQREMKAGLWARQTSNKKPLMHTANHTLTYEKSITVGYYRDTQYESV